MKVRYIKKKYLDTLSQNVQDELENNIMSVNDLRYLDNLNDENYNNGIVSLFFMDNDLVSLLVINSYDQDQIIEFGLPEDTCEIMDVFVFEQFRGRGLCKKMIEYIINDFPFPLKVTFDVNNIPAYKCYQKYFDPYNNEKNVIFLKQLWNLNGDYKTMIRN